MGRGLYRRLGLSPYPEEIFLLYYNVLHTYLQEERKCFILLDVNVLFYLSKK